MSFFILLYIPIIWLALAQGAKRCHDLGNSGWFQWIPFYYFIMLLKEGDKKTNYYEESPPVMKHTVVSGLLAVTLPTSGIPHSHGVTGGVYKTRERIHRSILICDY